MSDAPKHSASKTQTSSPDTVCATDSSPQAMQDHAVRQRKAAAIAVAAVAVFAAAVIGLVLLLDSVAQTHDDPNPEDLVIHTEETNNDPFYVLLIGSDSRKGTALYTGKGNESGQQDQFADIITLVRVDPLTFDITLLTIPRDTVPEGGTQKINAALAEGDPQHVVDAVANLVGIKADYYAMTTFTAFEDFIDALGGIDVDVPRTVTVVDPAVAEEVTVTAGKKRHLNGAETLVLARARKEYAADQEALRQVNVRTVEQTILEKVLALSGEEDLEVVLAAFEDSVTTDMDLSRIGVMALDFMANKDKVTFYTATGPYQGDFRTSDGEWVVMDDPSTWERIASLTDAGFDPSGVVPAPEF